MTSVQSPKVTGDLASATMRTTSYGSRASLRLYSVTDEKAIMEALRDPKLTHWLAALPVPLDRDAREKYLNFLADPDVCARVICIDGALAGIVSQGMELSFWIKREFHGKGLGLWAVGKFLEGLPIEIKIVKACCMHDNAAAAAVLFRLGFQCAQQPFRRFSFAHGHAVDFLDFQKTIT